MKTTDLRVVKTRKVIYETFEKLLLHKPFSKISVNEICKEALVHRTTFYKHFLDKYDLLEHFANDLIDEYINEPFEYRFYNPLVTLDKIFGHRFLRDNNCQRHDREFEMTLINIIVSKVQQDMERHLHEINIAIEIPYDLYAFQYAATLTALMEWNERNDDALSVALLDQYFQKMMRIDGVKNN